MTIILGLLGKFKYHLLAMAGLILAFLYAYNWAYDKGYSAKTSEYEKAYVELVEADKKAYDKKVENALALQKAELEAVAKDSVQLKEIEIQVKTVTKYVDKIVVKTECNDLATDIVGMLSEANSITVQAARSTKD